MSITFKRYGAQPEFGAEYEKVRRFLVEVNRERMINTNFLWARWEWAMSLIKAYGGSLDRNGLWYDGDDIVALATNEVSLGKASFVIKPGYEFLKPDILDYSITAFADDTASRLLIPDGDGELARIAAGCGYSSSADTEVTSAIDLAAPLISPLPDGFALLHLDDGYDMFKLQRCTYRGFGNGNEVSDDEPKPTADYQGPYFNRRYHTVAVAPNGDYAAYCGTWYDKTTYYAYVEPVCTDPSYRRLGLGRAVVYASLNRCAADGAKIAYVISDRRFYYAIGFYPVETYTWWKQNKSEEHI